MSKLHPVFNVDCLEPATNPNIIPDRIHCEVPPCVLSDNASASNEIETIFDSRHINGRLDYLVGFQDRSISERKWIASKLLPTYALPLRETFHNCFLDWPCPKNLAVNQSLDATPTP
jgi:hypothetical protein